MSGYETFNNMKPLISVCSSANVINVQGFIDELSVKFPNFNVHYFELPYNDIDHFTFKGEDVGIMILCHSINNRRFAITNVMDALYDRFLPNSAEILGKERICVMAHDFPATKGLDDPDKYKEEMETFENRQPTSFKTSSQVMMAGKLDGPVELQETNWQQLREFLDRAARSPMPEPKVCPGCCDPITEPLISVCSSANVINVQGFIVEMSVKFPNFNVQYFELPYNDIDHFTFKDKDVGIMILCHSINNRGLTITDVTSALYDRFLPKCAKRLGKERICVIAHDFPATKGLDDPDKYKEEMETFQYRQPTAFKTSSLVMMAGKLEGPVELQETNWKQLEEFLDRAVRSLMPKPGLITLYGHRWKVLRAFIFTVGMALIISLSVGLGGSSNTPVPTPVSTPVLCKKKGNSQENEETNALLPTE